ncbi:MAG: threonine/serine dehydratase [Candidatus Methylomirabilia bacterium]
MMERLVGLEEIRKAREALPRVIRRTPILPLARDSAEVGREQLFLKAENLQVTGAYKPRAAFTVINFQSPEERARGVVLSSSGNFAQGFAYAGACLGVPIVVVMMDRTSPYKVDATRGYGAEVVFCGNDPLARQPKVAEIAQQRGMTGIDTWESHMVIAGHASIGLEIIEDFPDVETILVPVSSGGLAAGVATAVKLSRPDIRVIGVQPQQANAAYVSLQRGEPTTIDYWDSLADGLSAVRPGTIPFQHLQKYLDEIVLIAEEEIAAAFRTLLFRAKLMGEPAGTVAPAAYLAGKVAVDRKTAALLSGGNVTESVAQTMLRMSAPGGQS